MMQIQVHTFTAKHELSTRFSSMVDANSGVGDDDNASPVRVMLKRTTKIITMFLQAIFTNVVVVFWVMNCVECLCVANIANIYIYKLSILFDKYFLD